MNEQRFYRTLLGKISYFYRNIVLCISVEQNNIWQQAYKKKSLI